MNIKLAASCLLLVSLAALLGQAAALFKIKETWCINKFVEKQGKLDPPKAAASVEQILKKEYPEFKDLELFELLDEYERIGYKSIRREDLIYMLHKLEMVKECDSFLSVFKENLHPKGCGWTVFETIFEKGLKIKSDVSKCPKLRKILGIFKVCKLILNK